MPKSVDQIRLPHLEGITAPRILSGIGESKDLLDWSLPNHLHLEGYFHGVGGADDADHRAGGLDGDDLARKYGRGGCEGFQRRPGGAQEQA